MTGSIRIFEKLNFTPKLSALAFLKVKLPNMTDWHTSLIYLKFLTLYLGGGRVLLGVAKLASKYCLSYPCSF